jgi:hypothetical protein
MRVIVKGSELKAAAYAGTYVVVLAWDTLDGKMPSRTDLLGYAIERAELDLSGNEVERYWMRGIDEIRQEFPNRLVRACARVSSSARRLCRSPTPTPPAGCPLDGAIMMPCPEGGRPFKFTVLPSCAAIAVSPGSCSGAGRFRYNTAAKW